MKINIKWFTLIEVLMWILIFSIVIVAWFSSLSNILVWRVKLIQQTDINSEAYYFSEKLFEQIKKWWTIDFEEYFNRKVVWTNVSSWHYITPTWFGNYGSWWNILSTLYGDGFYYCRSWSWKSMSSWTLNPNWWCYDTSDFASLQSTWNIITSTWTFQRYRQYRYQFIDFNSDANIDLWDQSWNWNIIWDDDDRDLWIWPKAFTWWENLHEIYLIWNNWTVRTYFRWNIQQEPWNSNSCNWNWTWCLWNIEMLKLLWKDWGYDHNTSSTWAYDSIIDTWVIHPHFAWWNDDIVAWSGNYWQPLFPDTLNVTDFQVYLYPNTHRQYAWREDDLEKNINPYLRIKIKLQPAWKKLALLKGEPPEIDLTTTINLVDYFNIK